MYLCLLSYSTIVQDLLLTNNVNSTIEIPVLRIILKTFIFQEFSLSLVALPCLVRVLSFPIVQIHFPYLLTEETLALPQASRSLR